MFVAAPPYPYAWPPGQGPPPAQLRPVPTAARQGGSRSCCYQPPGTTLQMALPPSCDASSNPYILPHPCRPAQPLGPPPYHHLAQQAPPQQPAQAAALTGGPSTPPGQAPPLPSLPDSLGSEGSAPATRPGLNPSAVSFSPTKPGRAAAAAAARGQREPATAAAGTGAPPVVMQPVMHSIFSK